MFGKESTPYRARIILLLPNFLVLRAQKAIVEFLIFSPIHAKPGASMPRVVYQNLEKFCLKVEYLRRSTEFE